MNLNLMIYNVEGYIMYRGSEFQDFGEGVNEDMSMFTIEMCYDVQRSDIS